MSLPRTMRAVVCPSVPISPTQLVYTTSHPAPQPKAGHVLIRIKGFGLNRSELYTRQGLSPGLVFPRVLGIECVGVVKDAGGGKWKEGDVVAAIMVYIFPQFILFSINGLIGRNGKAVRWLVEFCLTVALLIFITQRRGLC
jgi:NADPH:quinone reductase-like Zn-dependent oxidoreductase